MTPEEILSMAEARRLAGQDVKYRLNVCLAAGCQSCHGDSVFKALKKEVEARKLEGVEVRGVGCLGLCAEGPLVQVEPDGLLYQRVAAADAGEVIVHGMSNSSAVAALSGRLAVSGYIGWTYDLGVPDWSQRWNDVRTILSGAPEAEEAISRYGVDLVVIGPRERSEHLASDAYWSTVGVLVYERGAYRIYRTR